MPENIFLVELEFLFYGIGIVVLLWSLRRIVGVLPLRKATEMRIRRVLPLVDVAVGVGATVWITRRLFSDQPFYAVVVFGIVVALLLWASWFAIRDIVSGIILKAEGTYQLGQIITLDDSNGAIRHLGIRTLKVETEDGKRITLPYSQVARQAVVVSNPADPVTTHAFHVHVPASLGTDDAHQRLYEAALNVVWTSVHQPPRVQLLGVTAGQLQYEVTVYALGPSYAANVEQYVRAAIGKA